MNKPIELQELIDRCNEFIWGHMFTPPYHLVDGSLQHRDLVRTFFAGALETLMCRLDAASIEVLKPLYTEMTQESWRPGTAFFRYAHQQKRGGH
jgi:hypothetical protein